MATDAGVACRRTKAERTVWARGRGAGVSGVETKRAQDIFPSFVETEGILADGRHFVNGVVWELGGVGIPMEIPPRGAGVFR